MESLRKFSPIFLSEALGSKSNHHDLSRLPVEDDGEFDETQELVCRLGMFLKANNLPADLQPQLMQLKELDDLLVHASPCQEDSVLREDFCPYPKCYNGKVCYSHIFFCTKRGCMLCISMLEVAKSHAGQCTASDCRVPRCRELKQKNMRKERKLRKREERLKRLQQKELELKRFYDLQMIESQRAAAATAAARKLSVKDSVGDQSSQNDVNKLFGDLSFVSSTLASSKMEGDGERKEDKKE